jgi:hypothetical protein
LEKLDELFGKAERLKPTEAMWKRIEAGARASAERRKADSVVLAAGEAGEVGAASVAGEPAYGGERHWRLAASVALALGALAALFLVLKDPTGTGAPGLASREGGNGSASPLVQEVDTVLDEDILAWHADLGETSAMEWEYDEAYMVPDALVEPAGESSADD